MRINVKVSLTQLVALVVVVLAEAVVAERDCLTDQLDHDAALLDALTVRLFKLETQLQRAEARTLALGRSAKELDLQLNSLEGAVARPCPAGYFQCRPDSLRCVADIFVCDGSADCHSGLDEHPEICVIPITPGTVFSGITTPVQPGAPLPPTVYKAAAAIKKNPILASRPEVVILLVVYENLEADGPSAAFVRRATYNFATRTLYYEFSRFGNRYYARCYVTFRNTFQCSLGRAVLQVARAASAFHQVIM